MHNKEEVPECFLVVEKIYIDKVIVERFDLSNNFDNLGIKDLRGIMNIGANYGGSVPTEDLKPGDCCENNGGDAVGTAKKGAGTSPPTQD